MRLRELFEAPKKRAAFALGRMNPATTGHELLVNAIKQAPGDSFLFLTDRAPKLPDNPLTAEEKLDWARKSFDGIAIGLARTVLTAADRLYKMGYREVTFLEGEDKLYNLLKQYNGVEKEMHNYNFDKIDYVQLQRNAAAADATGMSGTKLRGYVTNNDLKGFKKGVTTSAQPYAEDMFKKLQGIMGVDPVESINEGGQPAPKKIQPLEMPTPPKAPDATIPRWRDGYTTNDGVTYKQDKYNEDIMTVSNADGVFTFDGARLIKWQTPRLNGYGQIYDFINRTITVKADTAVNTGDGNVVVSTDAVYDLKGNLKDAGNTKMSAGGFSISTGTKGDEIRYSMGSLEIRLKSNPAKSKQMNTDGLKALATKLEPLFKGGDIWKASSNANKYADVTLLWNGAAKHPAEIETLMKQSQGK